MVVSSSLILATFVRLMGTWCIVGRRDASTSTFKSVEEADLVSGHLQTRDAVGQLSYVFKVEAACWVGVFCEERLGDVGTLECLVPGGLTRRLARSIWAVVVSLAKRRWWPSLCHPDLHRFDPPPCQVLNESQIQRHGRRHSVLV